MFPQPSGRFGSALAVLDFNQDGLPDLAVGAPSVGSGQLTYNVRLGGRQRWRGGLGHGAVMPNASFQTVFLGLGSQSFLVLLYFRV